MVTETERWFTCTIDIREDQLNLLRKYAEKEHMKMMDYIWYCVNEHLHAVHIRNSGEIGCEVDLLKRLELILTGNSGTEN